MSAFVIIRPCGLHSVCDLILGKWNENLNISTVNWIKMEACLFGRRRETVKDEEECLVMQGEPNVNTFEMCERAVFVPNRCPRERVFIIV